MRIGLYTNSDKRCGNAEYARDLANMLSKLGNDVYLFCSIDNILPGLDVVLVSWSPSRVPMNSSIISRIKSTGAKVVTIWQESYDYIIDPGSWGVQEVLYLSDGVIAHEEVNSDMHIRYIPHGIVLRNVKPEVTKNSIGVAGFPFHWKNFECVAQIAKQLNATLKMIAPGHELLSGNAGTNFDYIKSIVPSLELHTDLLPVNNVIDILASCSVLVYWFKSEGVIDALGQSGSVRMGVAACRPMILSKHRKFKTLFPYTDEFYFCDSVEEIYTTITDIFNGMIPKVPKQVLVDQGWPHVAKLYDNYLQEIVR